MQATLLLVRRPFKKLRVVDGVLKRKRASKSPLKNPSERKCGSQRFKELMSDDGMHRWWNANREFATHFHGSPQQVSITAIRDTILAWNMKTSLLKRKYSTIRNCCALVYMMGFTFAVTPADWIAFISMSKHVRAMLNRHHALDYDFAKKCRNSLRTWLQIPNYLLADLVCFIRLTFNIREEDDQ